MAKQAVAECAGCALADFDLDDTGFDPLQVTIANTEDNLQILEPFNGLWRIVHETDTTIRLRFVDRASKTLAYGVLIAQSKRLWAY